MASMQSTAGMAAGENEGQVVKPAPAVESRILMIIIVILIITAIVDRPQEVLESPLGYVPALPPRRCVREAEVDALVDADVDCILGCVRESGCMCGGISTASGLVLVNREGLAGESQEERKRTSSHR